MYTLHSRRPCFGMIANTGFSEPLKQLPCCKNPGLSHMTHLRTHLNLSLLINHPSPLACGLLCRFNGPVGTMLGFSFYYFFFTVLILAEPIFGLCLAVIIHILHIILLQFYSYLMLTGYFPRTADAADVLAISYGLYSTSAIAK